MPSLILLGCWVSVSAPWPHSLTYKHELYSATTTPTFHITISGTVLALYGAVLATATAVVQVVSFIRDRVNVKVTYKRNMELVGHPDPRYHGMTLTILRAANAGRRPVTITGIGGYRLFPRKAFVCGDTAPPMPIELTEGKYANGMLNEAELDFENIEAFEAWDAVGRTFRCNVAPWYKRTWSRFARRFSKNRAN
jgi:hypothetical protein